jgi:hypothetical protein
MATRLDPTFGRCTAPRNAETKRFSLDSNQLAAELHAGRARIPEQSLTRKAMLRFKMQLMGSIA